MSDVYVIHLDEKIGGRSRHYIGTADDIETRLQEHADTTWAPPAEPVVDGEYVGGTKTGPGCTFLAVANYYRIPWHLARTFPGQGRDFERKLKNTKNAARYCPLCTETPRNYKPKES